MTDRSAERLVDLHAHILPGLDDGPKTMDEAVRLLQLLEADGVGTVVATPHLARGYFWPFDPVRMNESLCAVREAARQAGLAIEIVGGAEIYLSPEILPLAESGNLPTLGGSDYLLVEFSHLEVPYWGFELLRKLSGLGYEPLLAHPELNWEIRTDSELARELVDQGVRLQLDAGSLTGRWGTTVAATALRMVQEKLVFCVASDTHSQRRPPELSAARRFVAKSVSESAALAVFNDNPGVVVATSVHQPVLTAPRKCDKL